MRGTLRVGRLLGIDINLDWSWLVVFALITGNVTLVFRVWHPTWALGPALLLAVVAAVAFFASVVAHELAHAFVARGLGMRVRQIRLFLFGGVSDIEREPGSPGAECWMAIAGPLVSLFLGAVLTVVTSYALGTVDHPLAAMARLSPFQTIVYWLGPMNIAIGLFNLVPGFPLDGGRILRAAIWKATGDLQRATYISATAGRMIGLGMVVVGVAMALGLDVPLLGHGPGGLWLALIGWYLRVAAERSFVALVADDVLEGVRVSRLMRRGGNSVEPGATVRSAIEDALLESSEHALPVVEGSRLVGLVCIHDLRKVARGAWDSTDVRSVMNPRRELAVVGPDSLAKDALATLAHRDVNQLPVVDGRDVFMGMLSRRDVARWFELCMTAARRPLIRAPHPA